MNCKDCEFKLRKDDFVVGDSYYECIHPDINSKSFIHEECGFETWAQKAKVPEWCPRKNARETMTLV